MNNLHLTNFDLHYDGHGILTAILNVTSLPVNVFNESVLHDLDELIRAIEEVRVVQDDQKSDDTRTVKAVVFRSGKESGFLAGADLHSIEALKTSDDVHLICEAGQKIFHRLEAMRIPTIAVINGVCLGGGLEFVLACRHRIVIDDPRTKLGLPEVELGLLPAWGGTQRLPRRIGLTAALPMLLTGKTIGANEAFEIGLADAICRPENVNVAVARLVGDSTERTSDLDHGTSLTGGYAVQWQRLKSLFNPRGATRMLSWVADHTWPGQWLILRSARHGVASRERHYPALNSILKAVSAGLGNRTNRGFEIEREEFARLIATDVHHNLLGLFFQRERASKPETWVHRPTTKQIPVKKIGVVGAGVMGIGIAHSASLRGFDVVLKEVNPELLDQGLCHIRELFNESVRKHVLSSSDAAAKYGAITATTDWKAFADVDLAIEAVTERIDVKQSVFQDLERYCPHHAILVSNTSALSIHGIADAIQEPQRVLGLHFFNPVHRMPLVEIVRTERSSDEDVSTLVDFVKRFGKVPLVTEDRPGFLVNRILFPYLDEAVRLHCEGVPTLDIDRALRRFGMPMGPLELLDQIGIDVASHVADSLGGLSQESSPTGDTLREMVARGHLGRKARRGFYIYPQGEKDKPHQIKTDRTDAHFSALDVRDRILLRLVNEAAKCLQENVVPEAWMVDLGMVLGTGFAPFLGGPLRIFEASGFGEAVEKLEFFQKTVGPRFAPCRWLIDHIEHHTESQKI